ncbi:peptide deformylase [Corynebacterium massiliense]|uniref:Peptide deformylase n=1 Tax=Corynebacterium massiliense DSM 45435 TaxID=1121364 RepID=A0ABY7U993_9CORY|nr:peptide deformylase [Corynebacterium massiliense]WCZ33265.1 Peptide deformylase [Corynebacterium massiliense DSM 45435]
MSIRPIVIHGDPVLHNPTQPVDEDLQSPEFQQLIEDMYETMEAANGVGLAANQIGVNKRVFVYHCPDTDGPDGTEKEAGEMRRGCVINPALETSEIPETMPRDDGSDDEGCLSVPGESFPTGRADWARVTGTNEKGEDVSIEGYGFFARCLQHETGHLDGYVYTDVLTGRYKREAKKTIKKNGWTEPGLTWMPGEDDDPFGHDEA